MIGERWISSRSSRTREFRSPEEIDAAIAKLRRRVDDLEKLDARRAALDHSGRLDTVRSNVRDSIREVFGANSPEYMEHQYIKIWHGAESMMMDDHYIAEATENGRAHVIGILKGLIGRLEEKKADLVRGAAPRHRGRATQRVADPCSLSQRPAMEFPGMGAFGAGRSERRDRARRPALDKSCRRLCIRRCIGRK